MPKWNCLILKLSVKLTVNTLLNLLKIKKNTITKRSKDKESTRPNDFPVRERKTKAELLAKEVYDYLENNNFSFYNQIPKNELEYYDYLVGQKLSKP